MRIFHSTWLEKNQGVTLTAMNHERRLISYWFLKDIKDKKELETYIETGMFPDSSEEGDPYAIKQTNKRSFIGGDRKG